MSLKVCLYISAFGPGGAERQIVNLARELSTRSVEVTLLHVQSDFQDVCYLERILEEKNVDVINAFTPDFFKEGMRLLQQHKEFYTNIPAPAQRRMGVLYLAGAFSRLRPDVVHSYLDIHNCIAGCAAVLAGIPVHLASFRSLDPATLREGSAEVVYPIYQYLLAHARPHFEANSRAGREYYARWLNIDPKSIAYSPNGLDPSILHSAPPNARRTMRETHGIPQDAPVILTLSRFVWAKAPESMLDIFSRVIAARPGCHYFIAGSGMAMDEQMGALLKEHGLESHVHLLGARNDVAPLLSGADVFLLPSRVEGFPNAVMEAMMAGLPVVASHVGGIPDLVCQGQHGFLHDAADMAGMAQSVVTLLDDAGRRSRMGSAGKQRILEEFTVQRLGERTLRRYEEMLADAQQPLP